MELTDRDVEHIAKLAQLKIDAGEIPRFREGLANILDLVEEMQQVPTGGVEPLSNPLEATQRLRTDEVTEPDGRASFQAGAPAAEDGLYLVPRVVE